MGHEPTSRWDGSDYALYSAHHRSADDWFLRRHPPRQDHTVVDLGCGSGEFTARLAGVVSRGRVTGIDQDVSMLTAARRHQRSNLDFIQSPAETVDDVIAEASVDLLVSRSMLHWLPTAAHSRLFTAAFRILKPGGWMHFESAGTGNTTRVIRLLSKIAARHGLPAPAAYPDTGVAYEVLEATGFDIPVEGVSTVAQRRSFTRDEIIGFLRSQATVLITREVATESAFRLVEEVISAIDQLRRPDGSYDQIFVRLDIRARRPA